MTSEEFLEFCLKRDFFQISHYVHNLDPNIKSSELSEALCLCAYYELVDVMEKLIEYGALVEHKDSHLCTPIHWASFGGKLGSLKCLISKGVTTSARNQFWQTPIHILAAIDCIQGLEMIHQICNNLRSTDRKGWNVVHYACCYGCMQTLSYLIQAEIPLDESDKRGFRPIHLATARGHADIVNELLYCGVNPNSKTQQCISPLHLAVIYQHEKIFELLLSKGADAGATTNEGNSIFHFAFLSSNERFFNRLIECGFFQAVPNNHKQIPAHTMCLFSGSEDWRLRCVSMSDHLFQDSNGWSLLHYLAYSGDVNGISFLLQRNNDFIHQDNLGFTPAHIACCRGSLPAVQMLIEKFPEYVTIVSKSGENLLHVATTSQNEELFQYLISNGCDLNATDVYGRTPFHFAAFICDSDILEILKTDVNIQGKDSTGHSPIFYAIASNNMENVKFILKHSDDINKFTDLNQRTILHYAAYFGNSEIIQVLLDSGCSITDDLMNLTAVHYCLSRGHDQVLKMLLPLRPIDPEKDLSLLTTASANSKSFEMLQQILFYMESSTQIKLSDNGITPFHYLSSFGGHAGLQMVLDRFKPDQTLFPPGRSNPLHYAAHSGNENCLDLLLTALPGLIDSQNEENSTPLMLAAAMGNLACVSLLIKKKCNMDIQGMHGFTALHFAVSHQKPEVSQKLINEGANTNILDDDLRNVIFIPCIVGMSEILVYLLENQCEIEYIDKCGFTPLHWACLKGNDDCVEYLLQTKGRRLLFIGSSFSPFHCAVISNEEECVNQLIASLDEMVIEDDDDEAHMNKECSLDQVDSIDAKTMTKEQVDELLCQLADELGRSPLHYAVICENVSVIELLQRNSLFSPNQKDCYGFTPLMYAAIGGASIELLELVFAYEVDLSICDELGNSTLHIACRNNHAPVAMYISERMSLEHLNIRNLNNQTALHFAFKNSMAEVIDYLIERDVNLTVKDSKGHSVFSVMISSSLTSNEKITLVEKMLNKAISPKTQEQNEEEAVL